VEQIVSPPLSEQLRERIEERIVNGRYRPGTKLDEVELAASFKVSRTPIREALIQLSAAGLVDMRPRRGAVVAEVSSLRLAEMFDFMAELEAACARRAAVLASDVEISQLVSAHEACRSAMDAQDPDRYYRLNQQFHLVLYGMAHSGFLAEQTTLMQRRLRAYRRLQLRIPNRMASSFEEHAGVVEAIQAKNPNLAADRIRAHVNIQISQFTDLIAKSSA
jgi:DNA-binding GntR family transcriptional regulator